MQKKLQGHSASSHIPGFSVLDASSTEGEDCNLQLSSECREKFKEVVSSTPGPSDMQKKTAGTAICLTYYWICYPHCRFHIGRIFPAAFSREYGSMYSSRSRNCVIALSNITLNDPS